MTKTEELFQIAEEAGRDALLIKQLVELVRLQQEALDTCSPGDYSTGHVIHPLFDESKVSEALAAYERFEKGEG